MEGSIINPMKKFFTLACIIIAALFCSPLIAQSLRYDSFIKGQHELSIVAGYGENHRFPAATKDHFAFDLLNFRYAKFTSPTTQAAIEFCAGKQYLGQNNYSASLVTSYRKYFIRRGNTGVGYDLSIGLIHFNEHVQEQGTKTNFTEQAGITFQYATSMDSAFTMGYKFCHVSNAGIELPNIGINSSVVYVGYSWYKD